MKLFYAVFVLIFLIGCNMTEPPLDGNMEKEIKLNKNDDNKITICHKNGNGKYKKIIVSKSALQAHLNHGDEVPGGDVPYKPNYIFNEDCDCVEKITTDGLVAYYPFNNSANDQSEYENHGVINGAILTSDRFNNEHSALSFIGNSSVRVPHGDQLNFEENSFTISFWLNGYSTGNSSSDVIIIKLDTQINQGFLTSYSKRSNLLQFGVRDGNSEITKRGFAEIIDENWHHVVCLRDANTNSIKFYIDGELVFQEFAPNLNVSNSSDLYFGINPTDPTDDLYGALDDIRFYNRTLTESEILMLFRED